MSILDKAGPPPQEALIVTIFGLPGSGKTTMACTWPAPYLIRTQGEAIPRDVPPENMPASIGDTTTSESLFDQLMALAKEEHSYKSVIIDSVTGLEQMFIAEVIASDPKALSIAQAGGGWGAGRDAVAALHARVRKAAEFLRKRGINVVFLAHSDIESVPTPDSEGYSRHALALDKKKSATFYVDAVDVVGFLRQPIALIGESGAKRAIARDDRILVTYMTPSSVSKNRLGIEDDIVVKKGVNPLAQWVDPPKKKAVTKPRPEPKHEADTSNPAEDEFEASDFV